MRLGWSLRAQGAESNKSGILPVSPLGFLNFLESPKGGSNLPFADLRFDFTGR